MSIPVQYAFYNVYGDLLEIRSMHTRSYGTKSGDLNLIQNWVKDGLIEDHMKFIDISVRYAVPMEAPDYMFDLANPSQILPNKFK